MADTDQVELTDEARALAEELSLGPEDLLKLPDWIKLAKDLGIELKDLLFNTNTSVITVVNRTAHTLHFHREENREDGAFKVVPPDEIPPGETGTFLSGETSSVKGDESTVIYTVGDDPSFCQWIIHWNNRDTLDRGSGNSADSDLKYPSGQTRPDGTVIWFQHVEEWAQNGSTMVPFQFVIRDDEFGDATDGVVDRNSCVITVMNETKQSLFLYDTEFADGDIVTFPKDEIPPDDESTFEVSEKLRPDHRREGVAGYARFSVTQDPGHALWLVRWYNPETGENVADNSLEGASANLYQPGPPMMPRDQKEKTPVRFVLRDAGGGVVDPKPQPKETPPPETDEPTLRLGDKNVDGWVEYLQDLLEFCGAEPGTKDGVFGQSTHAAVYRFQHRMKAERPDEGVMADGIVGHQTWALLRGEDPRPPSTDGRTPHTYVEEGPEARWYQEDNWVMYDAGRDRLLIYAFNVGNVALEQNQFTATADLTSQSDSTSIQIHLLGPADGPAPVGTDMFPFALENASQSVGRGNWNVHAWLPAELGGDDHNGVALIGP